MEQYTGWQKQVHTLKAKTDINIVARKNTVGGQDVANLQKGQNHQSLGHWAKGSKFRARRGSSKSSTNLEIQVLHPQVG